MWQWMDQDPALALPLLIEAMLDADRADDELAHALMARHNPVIEAVRAEDRAASKAEGVQEGLRRAKAEGVQEGLRRAKAEAVLAVLAARKVAVGDAERVRILGERDPAQLDRWLAEAAICAEVAELFTTVDRR